MKFTYSLSTLKKPTILWIIFFLILFSFHTEVLFAQEVSSTSYIISSGSVNCGGGTSTSTSYILYDSLCEVGGPGVSSTSPFATSTSYVLGSGFQAMQEQPHISVSYSTTTIAFGTLSTASVSSAIVTSTVTTNAPNGYVSSIIASAAFRQTSATSNKIANVNDGSVTAGSAEYGFATSGTHGLYNSANSDTCIPYTGADSDSPACTTSAKTFASHTSWVSADATVITFKAAISTTTAAGNDYTQTVTLITTGTF
ncbi:hypothetical protein HYW94_02310 [Candidatus Uhrbacteria bacterium]|nr:hypothetical protein [Candidatus Uhrbacteria bacterium]